MKVYVEYSFIFDPGQIWENITLANEDLASFFRQKGFEAEIVESAVEQPNKVMIYLSKIEPPLPTLGLPEPKTMGELLKVSRQKRGFSGKFVKENSKVE